MQNDPDRQLEDLIHRELRKLPDREAPASLLPRVMAFVHTREARPWWQQPWLTWPRLAQAVSGSVFVTCLAGLGLAATTFLPSSLSLNFVQIPVGIGSFAWSVLSTLGNAFALVIRTIPTPYLLLGAAIVASSYFSCIGLATLCYRVALNKR